MPWRDSEERYKIFCELVAEARKSAELTQVELARKLGKTQSYVSKIENGQRRIDVIELLDLLDALGSDMPTFCEGLLGKTKRR